MLLVDVLGQDHRQELDDSSQEEIRFCSQGVKGSSLLHAKDILEGTNGTLSCGSFGIPGIPLRTVTQDAGIEPFVSVGVNVNATALFRGGPRGFTRAAQGGAGSGSDRDRLWTDKLQAFRPVLSAADAVKPQPGSIKRTKRNAGFIQKGIVFGGRMTAAHRNDSF